jgi:hypothetical protein
MRVKQADIVTAFVIAGAGGAVAVGKVSTDAMLILAAALFVILVIFIGTRWGDIVECAFCRVLILREHTSDFQGHIRCVVCAEAADDYPQWRTKNKPSYEVCAGCQRSLPRPALRGVQDGDDAADTMMLCRRRCLVAWPIRRERQRLVNVLMRGRK